MYVCTFVFINYVQRYVRIREHFKHIFCYREVALNMLLRLTEHSRIVVLLTHVLECYKKKKARWQEVSFVCVMFIKPFDACLIPLSFYLYLCT